MTNKEKMQKLSTEDLATFLLTTDDCDMCVKKHDSNCLYFQDNTDWQCKEGIADWLEEVADD